MQGIYSAPCAAKKSRPLPVFSSMPRAPDFHPIPEIALKGGKEHGCSDLHPAVRLSARGRVYRQSNEKGKGRSARLRAARGRRPRRNGQAGAAARNPAFRAAFGARASAGVRGHHRAGGRHSGAARHSLRPQPTARHYLRPAGHRQNVRRAAGDGMRQAFARHAVPPRRAVHRDGRDVRALRRARHRRPAAGQRTRSDLSGRGAAGQ